MDVVLIILIYMYIHSTTGQPSDPTKPPTNMPTDELATINTTATDSEEGTLSVYSLL